MTIDFKAAQDCMWGKAQSDIWERSARKLLGEMSPKAAALVRVGKWQEAMALNDKNSE